MEQVNQLKQSENIGVVVGVLKEKDITFGVGKQSGKAYAKGSLTVEVTTVDGINEVRVNVMQMALKKDGGENGLYKALQTIHNEYKSIVADGRENANTIKVEGAVEMNDYYSANKDEISSFLQVKGTLISRADALTEHCSKFKIGGFLEEIVDKEDQSIDVKLISIAYGGKAFPVTVTVPVETAQMFKSMYYVGCTADFNFDMVNAIEVTKKEEQVGFGVGLGAIAEKRIRVNKVFGGSPVYPMGYSQDQILQVKQIRNVMLETMLAEGKEKKANAPTAGATMNAGFGSPAGFQAPNGAQAGFVPPAGAGFAPPAGGFAPMVDSSNPFAVK